MHFADLLKMFCKTNVVNNFATTLDRSIQSKMESYENVRTYRQDVGTLLQQHESLSGDHGVDEHVENVGAPDTTPEEGAVGEVSAKRKAALTAEFAQRLRR